jgi:hypothetical protein
MILATQYLAIGVFLAAMAVGAVICFGLISLLLHFFPVDNHRDRAAEAADWLDL